jgi:hypothetical protein
MEAGRGRGGGEVLNDFGLAQYTSLNYFWSDVNSGFRKNVYAFETFLLTQKYFLDGQLVWAGNIGIEASEAAPLTRGKPTINN